MGNILYLIFFIDVDICYKYMKIFILIDITKFDDKIIRLFLPLMLRFELEVIFISKYSMPLFKNFFNFKINKHKYIGILCGPNLLVSSNESS